MRDVLASYGVITSIVLCIVIWMIQKWPALRKESYRAHLLGFEMECAELATPYKEHLFKALQYIVSNDEMLRSMGSIRILEIGVKTGANQCSGPARYLFLFLVSINDVAAFPPPPTSSSISTYQNLLDPLRSQRREELTNTCIRLPRARA